MTLSINNPYALSEQEADQMKAWEAMSDDDKGVFLHYAKQEDSIQQYVAKKAQADFMNDHVIQRLANGGAQVGGALRPDALVIINGLEMTVQQAVDVGVYSSDALNMQTADMLDGTRED